MRRFRRLNHLWARIRGYSLSPCPICGEMFGGHERGTVKVKLPSEYLPGLREPGEIVDVTEFPRYAIACWKHVREQTT